MRSVELVLCFAFTFSWVMSSSGQDSSSKDRKKFAVVVHGGAISTDDRLSEQERQQRVEGLRAALVVAQQMLVSGATALDTVERTIRILEDDPQFNAGRGAVFNHDGGHELDASIMDGRDRSCGAIAGAKTVKNPISLARLVMSNTRHVLLVADGADRFAAEMKVEQVPQSYFSTPEARADWEKVRSSRDSKGTHMGTVGCAVLDSMGNLAAGTSTGGLTDKKYGRVGDSPIIGAGTYADNSTCAVSCTGVGEHFIRHAVSHDVVALMAYKKMELAAAVREVLEKRLQKGHGGIIAVDKNGVLVGDYNCAGLCRGMADSAGRLEIIVGK